MQLPRTTDRMALLAAALWLSSATMSVLHGEEPAPPAAATVAEPEATLKIAGRIEALDDKVVGIVTTGDFEPNSGDAFEVFITPPNGERGRVGRGKITFARNGVVLGRLEEATGEIAAGLEVSIQSPKPQRRVAATPTPTPTPTPAPAASSDAVPPAAEGAAPGDAAPVADTKRLSGQFVGDDPRFPFVLQVKTHGDTTLVRGMGRVAYSADDPTLILAEFVGVSLAGDQPSLRGVLTLHPDGDRLTEKKLSPWVGLYDPANDDLQMMLSPQHVIGASRPGVAAKGRSRATSPPRSTGNSDIDKMQTVLFTATEVAAQGGPAAIDAALAVDRIRTNVQSGLTQAHNNLLPLWNQASSAMVALGNRLLPGSGASLAGPANPPTAPAAQLLSNNQRARDYHNNLHIVALALTGLLNGDPADNPYWDTLFPPRGSVNTGPPASPTSPVATRTSPPPTTPTTTTTATPPPANPVDRLIGRSFEDVMAGLWARGLVDNRPDAPHPISYTLRPPRNPAQAGQVADVRRDASGRIIEIISYGSAPGGPNVAQGGAGTTPGGSTPAAPPNLPGGTASTGGAGSGATGGSGTPPSGTGGTRTPDATTRVANANGTNRVPGNPPNVPPPSTPGGPKPPSVAPAPPVPVAPPRTPLPERQITRQPSTGTGPSLDPEVTVLVDDDSSQTTAERINAARDALNRANARARAAGGLRVETLAKGPKGTDAEHHHDTPGAKPDDKKPHPLAGTWKLTAATWEITAGHSIVVTIDGRSMHIVSTVTGPFGGTTKGDASIEGSGKGPYTLKSTGGGTSTATISADNSTFTVDYGANGTATWQRIK